MKAYLPPYELCPFLFLKDLLRGEKELIFKKNLKIVDVPRWKEFNINEIYKWAINDKRFSLLEKTSIKQASQ